MTRNQIALLFATVLLGGCQPAGPQTANDPDSGTPTASVAEPSTGPGPAFSRIAPDETVHFTGTEPFWGGEVTAGRLTYATPENQDGTTIPVEMFSGNQGVAYSGMIEGVRFDMMVTNGACSDGMSDRGYPFTVTLRIGEESRSGCAWTDRVPFTGPRHP